MRLLSRLSKLRSLFRGPKSLIRHRPRRLRTDTGACVAADVQALEDRVLLAVIGNNQSVGDELRNYRLAIAATAEYTTFFGGQANAFASIQSFVTDLNTIFEPELAIHFDLVSGTNVVFTNPGSDGYTNGNPSTMMGQNQNVLDNTIGSANYDVGHVFGTTGFGSSGIAALAVVGENRQKARGASTADSPLGIEWLNLVAHEIAHQFGGEHTFNGWAEAAVPGAKRLLRTNRAAAAR